MEVAPKGWVEMCYFIHLTLTFPLKLDPTSTHGKIPCFPTWNSFFRILQHFNTTPEEYAVVFTSGCTEGLKLLANTFTFHSNDHCGNVQQEETNPVTEHNSDLVWKVYDGRHGNFCYLDDNHTSVVGMREVVKNRGAAVFCFSKELFNSHGAFRSCEHCHGNSLFAYPAQSNFSGERYPLDWIDVIKRVDEPSVASTIRRHSNCQTPEESSQGNACYQGNSYVLLDAAGYVCTSHLDLRRYQPDFVPISFYKIFGFPTGLGELIT